MRTNIIAVVGVLSGAAVLAFTAIVSGSSGGTAVATEPTAGSTGTVAVTRTAQVTRTVVVTATPASGEGCTPGYWKVEQHHDSWVGYSPNQTLESVFDVPDSYGVDNVTLVAAMSFGGGPTTTDKAKLLLHHAVAALLNSTSPDVDYPWLTADVISETNDALASGNKAQMQTLKNVFDADNNAGCPLN